MRAGAWSGARLLGEERGQMLVHGVDVEARQHLASLSALASTWVEVEVELFAPDQARLLALLDDAVEEAAEDVTP